MMGFPAPPQINDSSDDEDNVNVNKNNDKNNDNDTNIKDEDIKNKIRIKDENVKISNGAFTFAPSTTKGVFSVGTQPQNTLNCFGLPNNTNVSAFGMAKPSEVGCVFPRPPQVQNANEQCVFPVQQVNHTQNVNVPRAFGGMGGIGGIGGIGQNHSMCGPFGIKETKVNHPENDNKEVMINIYNQMSMMRNQIEQLTKAIDNMYIIISKIK